MLQRAGARQVRETGQSIRITATVTREQERLLKALAAKNKTSVAWLIRVAVDRLLLEQAESVQLPLDLGGPPKI